VSDLSTSQAAGRLENLAGVLGSALTRWAERDRDGGANADQVRAGSEAMAAIDDAMAELHRVRGRLVAERRADFDATMARTDAMLAGSTR
jgi:hypothetical protein